MKTESTVFALEELENSSGTTETILGLGGFDAGAFAADQVADGAGVHTPSNFCSLLSLSGGGRAIFVGWRQYGTGHLFI